MTDNARNRIANFEMFGSRTKSWETLCQEAAAFASGLAPEDVISISHSNNGAHGMVIVWFWDAP